jgi:hypothetical protein
MKRAYKVPKAGGSSIVEEYTWRGINISLTGKSKEGSALTFQLAICEIVIRSGSLIQEGHVAIDQSMTKVFFGVSDTGSWRSQGSNSRQELVICEITKRSGPSNHQDCGPLI